MEKTLMAVAVAAAANGSEYERHIFFYCKCCKITTKLVIDLLTKENAITGIAKIGFSSYIDGNNPAIAV